MIMNKRGWVIMRFVAIFAMLFSLLSGAVFSSEPDYTAVTSYDCQLAPDLAQDPNKPNILIVGDSISLQYTPTIQALMTSYNVVHSPCNAAFSGYAALHIDDWLDRYPVWDAIIFNVGVWDLNSENIPVYSYATNLAAITAAISARTDVAIFVTTTSHPNFPDKKKEMRMLALNIMLDHGVHVFDLEKISEGLEAYKSPDMVHYTPQGSFLIGAELANFLAIKLGY